MWSWAAYFSSCRVISGGLSQEALTRPYVLDRIFLQRHPFCKKILQTSGIVSFFWRWFSFSPRWDMLVSRRVPIKHSNFHFSGDYVSCLGKWADWFPELAMWPDFRWAMMQFDHIRPRSKCTCRWWICYNYKYRAFLLWKEVIDPSTFIIWCNFTLTNGGLGFRTLVITQIWMNYSKGTHTHTTSPKWVV